MTGESLPSLKRRECWPSGTRERIRSIGKQHQHSRTPPTQANKTKTGTLTHPSQQIKLQREPIYLPTCLFTYVTVYFMKQIRIHVPILRDRLILYPTIYMFSYIE
uniref:Uncharacterized protein n=2 Tax=Cacopsylla melanoneura TaxID=428564 RepID=A0A8D9BHF2_9HEMI